MKAGWVYPIERHCGISFYAGAYVKALNPHVRVVCVDPSAIRSRRRESLRILNECDIVHVQYETALFVFGRHDIYSTLCRGLLRPLVVSLHEVYPSVPGVFPRDRITGRGLAGALKRRIYDLRHPYVTALRAHRKHGFHAEAILVHYRYQRAILQSRGVNPSTIHVIPYPVRSRESAGRCSLRDGETVHLAATGFINPAYDYPLLLEALGKLRVPWRFTWIGGPRRDEDRPVLEALRREIESRRFSDKVEITGWVTDQRRDEILGQCHVYCALFRERSSSESFATALSARRLIVAMSVPFIEELTADFGPLALVTDRDADSIARAIERILTEPALRNAMYESIEDCIRRNAFDVLAPRLAGLYHKLPGSTSGEEEAPRERISTGKPA